jgi:hypothetical protein
MTTVRGALIIFIVSCYAVPLLAQNDDCELTLSRASDEFNAGHFYSIPSILSPCLSQLTREQSQRAYLLLTQTYLLLDDPIGARQSYMNILKANPEFVTDTALHPIDVIYLSKKFTATSIFSWYANMGANVAIPRMIYDLSAFGLNPEEKYQLNAGYQGSIGGDLNFTEKINLRGGLMYMLTSYKHKSYQFEKDSKEVTNHQHSISIPLTLNYNDDRGKYRPYGYLGYSWQYLLRDRDIIVNTDNRPSGEGEEREDTSEESPELKSEFKRNRFNQSVLVGGGLKIKIGLDFLFVDLRYSLGLKNVTSRKYAYGDYKIEGTSDAFIESLESGVRFAHVEDYFRLDNLSISIGFLRPLYKPRELKRARTRSVMKQFKR